MKKVPGKKIKSPKVIVSDKLITKQDWTDIKDIILELITSKKSEWITEAKACELLNIKKSTLLAYVNKGKITPDMYRIGIGRTKFYDRKKIIKL